MGSARRRPASLSARELIERPGSWSTVVRERAATELARRNDDIVPDLVKMLDAPNLTSRYSACQALAQIKGRATPAVPVLTKNLKQRPPFRNCKGSPTALKKVSRIFPWH